MVSQTDLFRLKCITNGVSDYSSLPRPSSKNNVKGYLKNIGKDSTFNVGRIQADETLQFAYVNGDKKLDVLRCIIPTDGYDLAAIAGNGIMSTTMVSMTHIITPYHCFVTFMSKQATAMGGFKEIQDVQPDSLKKSDGSTVSLADIGLSGDDDEPKLVILPIALPITSGWTIPIGHKVNEVLPPSEGTEYHPTMIAWLEGIKNLEDTNKGVPVTGASACGGTLFGSDQFHQSVDSDEENDYDKICNETGELLSKDTYHLNPTPVLPGSDIHTQYFDDTERISKRALFDFVQSLPADDHHQPPPAPTDFLQVSKVLADAISKGISSSSDSKKSGFSNNVEERLKLLGSFTGSNEDGEEVVIPAILSDVCMQFFKEKNKTAATRIFQDAMKAEAVAMQDEGGNIAANDLIFHIGQFTQVFANHLKNFHFMTTHLAQNPMDFDATISLLNFLPADERNPSFRAMMQSDRTAQDEDEMECDLAKHTRRTTKLFVDGNQETAHHLCTCLATFCCFLRAMFTNGKQSLAHEGFMNLLKYIKSSEGVNWLATETRTYRHVVHHLMCESHSLLVAILRILSYNDSLVKKVKNKEDIPIANANRVIATCTNLLQLWRQRSINPVSDFTIAPTTFLWFPIGTGQAVANRNQQLHPAQPQQPKQQKGGGGGGTPAPPKPNGKRQDTNAGNGNVKRVKTEEDMMKEKKGWLCLSVNSKKLPVCDAVTDGKRLCLGFTFLGRSCGAESCNRIHATGIDQLSGEFKKKIIVWVESPSNKVQWAPGKEPKSRE
jgi:hypothetical protein